MKLGNSFRRLLCTSSTHSACTARIYSIAAPHFKNVSVPFPSRVYPHLIGWFYKCIVVQRWPFHVWKYSRKRKWCSFNFNCASKQGHLWSRRPWILSKGVDLSAWFGAANKSFGQKNSKTIHLSVCPELATKWSLCWDQVESAVLLLRLQYKSHRRDTKLVSETCLNYKTCHAILSKTRLEYRTHQVCINVTMTSFLLWSNKKGRFKTRLEL